VSAFPSALVKIFSAVSERSLVGTSSPPGILSKVDFPLLEAPGDSARRSNPCRAKRAAFSQPSRRLAPAGNGVAQARKTEAVSIVDVHPLRANLVRVRSAKLASTTIRPATRMYHWAGRPVKFDLPPDGTRRELRRRSPKAPSLRRSCRPHSH
jgi:hypothetical protein